MATTESFPFKKLPAELRSMVYEHVAVAEGASLRLATDAGSDQYLFRSGLIFACSQVSKEYQAAVEKAVLTGQCNIESIVTDFEFNYLTLKLNRLLANRARIKAIKALHCAVRICFTDRFNERDKHDEAELKRWCEDWQKRSGSVALTITLQYRVCIDSMDDKLDLQNSITNFIHHRFDCTALSYPELEAITDAISQCVIESGERRLAAALKSEEGCLDDKPGWKEWASVNDIKTDKTRGRKPRKGAPKNL